jgi:hypothetical protein
MHQHTSSLKLLGKLTANLVCSILVTVTLKFARIMSTEPEKENLKSSFFSDVTDG